MYLRRDDAAELCSSQSVISGAEIIPSGSVDIMSRYTRRIFSEDNGETELEMPVNVAVKIPRTGVVSGPTNGNVITSRSERDDVTTRWIGVVVGCLSCAANNVENVLLR